MTQGVPGWVLGWVHIGSVASGVGVIFGILLYDVYVPCSLVGSWVGPGWAHASGVARGWGLLSQGLLNEHLVRDALVEYLRDG